jgi:AbrB family looped-hinge helix DNA binding protein
MSIETIKMSSRGQVVIPQDIREAIGADEGTIFAVTSSEDAVVLKKINMPSKEELISHLKKIALVNRKKLEDKGISESDLQAK